MCRERLRVDYDDVGVALEGVGDERAGDAATDNHHGRPPAPVRMDPSGTAGRRAEERKE